MDIFEWSENIPVTANNLNEMQNVINNNISKEILHVYSTSEKRVGTWTNGKPIYEITLYYNVTGNTSTDIASLNAEEIIDYNSMCYRYGNSSGDWEKPYYISSSDYFRSFVRTSTKKIETRITISSLFATYQIRTTLRYTKTTD